MQKTYNLLIIYSIGDRHVVKGVSDFGINGEYHYFWYIKDGHRAFIPMSSVDFFGCEDDYENKVVRL